MATTYRLGCCPIPSANHEEHNHEEFNPPLPIGERKNRAFTPSEVPQYGTPTDPPSEIVAYDVQKQFGFPAEEQLPAGVSPEEYKLAHHVFRQLEEKNIAVLFWKVAEHLIPEPGRLANDHLDLFERDLEK